VEYLGRILEFEKMYPNEINAQNVRDYLLLKPVKEITVYDFWQQEIDLLYKNKRDGGAQIYKEALISIHKLKSLEISFERIDYNFLKELEAMFAETGMKVNTISLKLRTLRAVYNKAINAKVASYKNYPFRNFRIKKAVTKPRPISLDELRVYFNLKIDKNFGLHDSWLLGKLMFMLIGINFRDLILLTETNIRGDRLFYSRAKTKRLYSIRLLPEAAEIINYFKSKGYYDLFGKVSQEDLNNPRRLTLIIRQRNKVFNSHLNALGKAIGCSERLTGYVFRYTWANIAKKLGYSKDLIAEALGHEYGNKVTGIYLEAYDKELIDEMNAKIIKTVFLEKLNVEDKVNPQ
jgi:integrase